MSVACASSSSNLAARNNIKSKTSSKWPLLYSVDIQCILVFLCTVYVSFVSPFPTSLAENEHLNFIHDYIYDRIDRFQV
jgi:hypothetical protein